jgi:Zn-dependent peptidase ImmA (M78 family)/DNA-binding XRE family transcriptional regulator
MPAFNPEMMVLARELAGLTQGELARRLKVSQGEISKVEGGVRPPSEALLEAMADVLKCPVDFFFVSDPIRNFGSSCVYHRKRQSTPQKVLGRLLALVNKRRIQIKRLLKSVEVNDNLFPRIDIDEHFGNAAEIARIVRATWKTPPGPLSNLTSAVEDAGGLVIRCEFGTNKVDAFSQWLPDMPPLFFVNVTIPADRVRFSLAHEIGHIVMHQLPTDDMEREADRFAAEFLMPESAVRPDLIDVSLPRLAVLKPKWKVSMAALLKRAGDLEMITPRTKNYLWFRMGSQGYKLQEPVSIPDEEPRLLREIIDLHRNELGYTIDNLAKLLVCTEDEVRTDFLQPQTALRLI